MGIHYVCGALYLVLCARHAAQIIWNTQNYVMGIHYVCGALYLVLCARHIMLVQGIIEYDPLGCELSYLSRNS